MLNMRIWKPMCVWLNKPMWLAVGLCPCAMCIGPCHKQVCVWLRVWRCVCVWLCGGVVWAHARHGVSTWGIK